MDDRRVLDEDRGHWMDVSNQVELTVPPIIPQDQRDTRRYRMTKEVSRSGLAYWIVERWVPE